MIRNLMDGNGMENMIKHFCPTELLIGSFIKCENGQPLPFEKTAIYNISKGNCIPFRETGKGKIETINLSQYNSEKVEITFKLDIDMIYDIQIKAIGPPLKSTSKKSSKVIPEKSAQKNVEKVKIIFTQTHFSIFIVKDGKKKVIKDSNGSTNIPLCISFVEDIPIVGKKAEESLLTQPTFVVYDLMKLCSKDVLKNKDPKWPFKLRKNSKTIFLVEFDTVSGRRKKAADVFIKVILIFCLELIEKESGKNFKEIGIEFEGFGNQEDLCECFLKAADRINMKLVFL
uniref:Uncharacterized protein n=1 Tax=Panagrolaimus sp. ES5 TaxID=591445 RepID=A0AC34FC51_9BILA